ncbi:MAG: helix-turn-helix transcriptional regulator [bacterium]
MTLRKIVGENIRGYRHKAELTQARLAAKAGMDMFYLGELERGKVNVSIDTLEKIALMILIGLLAIGLPTFINSFSTNPSVTAILMTGLVIITILAGAIMLLLFGVIGIHDNAAKSQS